MLQVQHISFDSIDREDFADNKVDHTH